MHASDTAVRTGYRIAVLGSAGDIPADVWQRLAPPNDPLWTRAMFRAMERDSLGPDVYRYVLLYRGEDVCAILPVCAFHQLSLRDIVGEDGRRALRRVPARLLRIRILLCGHLLGEGRVMRDPGLGAEAAGLLIDAVREVARSLGSRWTVFKDFVGEDLDWLRDALRRARFFDAPGLPDAVLPLTAATFDDYVSALPAKPRRNTRSKIRKFAAFPDTAIEVHHRFGDLVPELMPLYRAVLDRAESRLDVLTPEFLQALSEDPDIRATLVTCRKDGQMIAFLLCLFVGTGAIAFRVGLDYERSSQMRLYHIVHYRGISEAIGAGSTTMNFTQTAYEPKLEMGCHLVPLDHAVTHRNPIVWALLRRFLPMALNQGGRE